MNSWQVSGTSNLPRSVTLRTNNWILCQIKDDSGSPISGWPEAKVRIMAQNKAKGMAGAQLQTDLLPLHTYSLS